MKSPHDLKRDDLAALVADIQRALYLEPGTERAFIWNPEKEVDASAFVQLLDELMGRRGLHPASEPFTSGSEEVEFEGELSGPVRRNPELAIREGNLIGHLSPNMKMADIVFASTLSKIVLLKRRDVEDLRRLCDQMLEFMRD